MESTTDLILHELTNKASQAGISTFTQELKSRHCEALYLLGKLDGMLQFLEEKNLFLLMFLRKEFASSCQLEGVQSSMQEAVDAEIARGSQKGVEIIHLIHAFNNALKVLKSGKNAPFLLQIHKDILGEEHSSNDAGDVEGLEAGFFSRGQATPSLIQAALYLAQFEKMRPFNQGNGRASRLSLLLFLLEAGLLSAPTFFISSFFLKHRSQYNAFVRKSHDSLSDREKWVHFFLGGIQESASSAIQILYKVQEIRKQDQSKILGHKSSVESTLQVLKNLYKQPVVDAAKVQEWTGFTRAGAQRVIERLMDLKILCPAEGTKSYGKRYLYKDYFELFNTA